MTSPRFFATPEDFRDWLREHHQSARELVVGFYKRASGKTSITWPESVDEALCFGWIDGVRKSIDVESYTIRFTPRKPRSIWSNVNIAKVQKLIEQNRMSPAGMAAWARREEARSGIYSFEGKAATFDAAAERAFKKIGKAWEFFQTQPAGYRRLAAHYVASAKREETRTRRLAALIEHSARKARIPQFAITRKPV